MRIGIDIGSTTIKAVVLNQKNNVAYRYYERHFGKITQKVSEMLHTIRQQSIFPKVMQVAVTGSAAIGISQTFEIPFVQEVYATRISTKRWNPDAQVVIELGGEDAKILFQEDIQNHAAFEARMNGSCAGGTGAFIDQMATLLNVELTDLDAMAKKSQTPYTIASRCGVFAKSDIQALLNQGASKEDMVRSILDAIVNQTVAGLAQGREITGNVLYLGGPLTFFKQLRKEFDRILNIEGTLAEDSLYYSALGAALADGKTVNIDSLIETIEHAKPVERSAFCIPLFESREAYKQFKERHASTAVQKNMDPEYAGDVYIGIDAGSTTVKCLALDDHKNILMSTYQSVCGNSIAKIRGFLMEMYRRYPNVSIKCAQATGYGESLVKKAFRLDGGCVETVAHLRAAQELMPEVDFIVDIGGQDIKCFRIRGGAIDDIFLNEACSSGCGSFLQTFAHSWNLTVEELAAAGLFAKRPVDLGSRCTVFMNSSVKQAQREGATLEDIAAGLSISVVKNAIHKVIRTGSTVTLGQHIMVQGGTFLNDAVLRAFEQEIGSDVVRPEIAELMGAYGAALIAMDTETSQSIMLTPHELQNLTHRSKLQKCTGCSNQCHLTINQFSDGRQSIGGNRCEKPLHGRSSASATFNIYEFKRKRLQEYQPRPGKLGKIGIPMGLNMYELLPFWHTLLTSLGFEVIVSPESNRNLFLKGQHTIPSDTVCYPAKLMHGHIEWLLDSGITTIFYPCLSYNFDEGRSDNHYNCPVVAYYPELLNANSPRLQKAQFIFDYLGIHDPKYFTKRFYSLMKARFPSIKLSEVKKAVAMAYAEYKHFMQDIRTEGLRQLEGSKRAGIPVVVLSGRPYHIDAEINHGIDRLIAQMGAVVLTEDALEPIGHVQVNVLNQWTYHARLYSAAATVAAADDCEKIALIQLVSFGCGMDAITSDEIRSILEQRGKIYTQLKIDEISNLDAVRIRLRSLFAALRWEGNGTHEQ